jgi:8-oxo-dGTP diphosphatase
MAKSSKLVAAKRGRVLLVRRKRDGLWMFPGGRKLARESHKDCLRREIKEELPRLKLGRVRLWKEVKAKNRRSGRKMSDAIFVTAKASGRLTIGDRQEIDKATWRKPRGIRLTPTSRYTRQRCALSMAPTTPNNPSNVIPLCSRITCIFVERPAATS